MKTIKDVAAYSGVSLTTVSRVVNGSDKVSPKTKAKVDQAIKELGYFPNNAARSLVKKQAMVEHLQEVGFPFLLIENNFQMMPVNQFLIDNVAGARDAVNSLIRHNHKRIAHVMGNPNKKVILERLNGYIETMQDNGLLIQDYYIQNTLSDSTLSLPKFREMMNRPKGERPTAIFCSNDKIAIMVINELTESGFKVPEDVSVVGFDNLNTYGFSYRGPRITSISQPLYQIGYDSIISIDGVLQGSIETPINKFYPTTLEEHETVCSL